MLVKSVAIMQMNPRFKPAMKGAIRETLKTVGFAYRDQAKRLTTDEGHVVTGRYRSSIGNMKSNDGIFKFGKDDKYLDVGTNVPYSIYLEGRYSLLARAVDFTAEVAATKAGVVFAKYLDSHS